MASGSLAAKSGSVQAMPLSLKNRSFKEVNLEGLPFFRFFATKNIRFPVDLGLRIRSGTKSSLDVCHSAKSSDISLREVVT